mmetsp:Transcript_23046/g.54790  ORF Transcript_23046/g.54790 Transcript_23046/m.54790 type:complete len:1052 (-) Transcript_23046:175-3330(-)
MTDTDSCSSFAETPTRLPSTRSNGDSISSMRTALPGLVQMEDANSTRKSGFLDKEKEGGLFKRGWNKRWFSISAFGLSYYEKPDDPLPRKTINFSAIKQVTRAEGTSGILLATNIFNQDGKARKYNLRASNDTEADEWAEVIRVNLKNFNDAQKRAAEVHYLSMESEEGSDYDGASVSGSFASPRGGRRMSTEDMTSTSTASASSQRRGSMGSLGIDMMRRFTSRRGSVGDYSPGGARMARASTIKTLVSKKKKRFVDSDFDLDLSYVTPRIIAMGFPSEGLESVYRNPYSEVYRFLETYHSDAYKVYNLCSERSYDPARFHDRVICFPFDDHNPPPFEMIRPLCRTVERFLAEAEDHVVAVHCKGGKGRTGLMIACFLLYAGHADETPIRNIQEAIDYFADRRTDGGLAQATHPQTVTGVSQLRCVRYFDEGHRTGLQYRRIRLTKVVFTKVPDTGSTYFKPVLRVSKGTHEVYRSYHTATRLACCARGANTNKTRWFQSGEDQMMELECTDKVLYIAADFKLELFNGNPTEEGQKLADEAVCFACLHASKTETSPLVLKQAEIDQAARDVGKHKVFPAGFEIHVHFETVEPSEDQEKRSLTFNEDQQLWFAHKMVEELEPDVFESGETVLRVGQDEDKMYLVGKGSVRMELGARVLQGTVGPLEIVAEQQLLLDNARLDGDVVANLDPTILYPIDRQTISAYFYDDVGEFYHVLCIKMVAKMVDRAAVIGNRGGVGEDGEEGEAPAKQQRHLKQIELPVNERVLEQRECWMSETGARSRGRMLLTQNYLVFKAGSLTSSTKLLKLAKVLKAEAKEQGPSLDVTITSFLPLTKEKDSNASIGLASTTCTFHLPNPGSRGMLEALQKQLDERTSFSLSWMEGEPAHPSWPFRVDEALHPLFLLAQMAQPFGGINQRQSFVRRSVGAVPRPLSFSSRTKGDEVHLSSRASISKIKNWGADSTLYVVLKGHLVVSHHQHIIARYGPGEIFGLIQFIDPSLKEVLHVTAGAHGGATLKAIPKEHLRQLLARDREFHAMFWEFGAKVLASGLRIL